MLRYHKHLIDRKKHDKCLFRAFYAKLRIETSRTVGCRGMSLSYFFIEFSWRATLNSSRYFAPHAFTIRSIFCWRGSKRENDGDDDDVAGSLRVNRDTRERGRTNGDFEIGRMERVLNIAEVRRRNVDGSPYLSSVAVVAADADRVGAGNGISARRSQWRWQARTATTPSRISNIVTWNNHRSENAQGVSASKAHWSRIQSYSSFLDFIDRCIHGDFAEVSKNLNGCRTENNFVRLSKFLDRTLKLIARMSKNFDKRGESYQDDTFPLSDMLTAIIKTI